MSLLPMNDASLAANDLDEIGLRFSSDGDGRVYVEAYNEVDGRVEWSEPLNRVLDSGELLEQLERTQAALAGVAAWIKNHCRGVEGAAPVAAMVGIQHDINADAIAIAKA